MIKGLLRTLLFVGSAALFSFTTPIKGEEMKANSTIDSSIIAQNNSTPGKNSTIKMGKDGRVGIVVSVKGKNFIQRDAGDKVVAAPKTNVLIGDELTTSNEGYLQVTFVDGSILKLVGKGSVSVKDFLYDEEKGEAGGELTTEGATFVFMSGKISKIAPQNFKVKTATATIGIRGSTIDASVGSGGEMKLTGGGIFAEPIGGGDMVEFSHDGPQVAFEFTEGGVQEIPVPDEGGFFASKATELFGEDADSITATEDDEEEEEEEDDAASDDDEGDDDEEEEEKGSTLGEGEVEEESAEFALDFEGIDISSILEDINQFDLDEDLSSSEAKLEGMSGHFFKKGELNKVQDMTLFANHNRLFIGSEFSEEAGKYLEYSGLTYKALANQGADVSSVGFLAFTDNASQNELGYIGKEKGIEYLNRTDGIMNFTSAMPSLFASTNTDFPLSVVTADGYMTFTGENDLFVDIAHESLFGSVSFESLGGSLTDPEGASRNEFYQQLDFMLASQPDLLFYTKHQSLDKATGDFGENSLHLTANLGYGVVNGEFLGSSRGGLTSLDDFDGSAQLYGDNTVEGVGLFSSPSSGEEGGFVAASFSEGTIIEDLPTAGLVEYVGFARGSQLSFNSVNNLVSTEIQHADALSFSIDLATKELDESSLNFKLSDAREFSFTPGTSFVLSQELAFSALDHSSVDPTQSFILANPVPIVNAATSNPVKVEGVLWGSYNLVSGDAQTVNPGQMNFFVAADVTEDSYFLNGSSIKSERTAVPLAYYEGAARRTIVDPDLFAEKYEGLTGTENLPFFTEEGYSKVLINYEDETFKHYSVFPDGFLIVGSGDLGTVDLNGSEAGGEHFGFTGNKWSVINLGAHFHTEMFQKEPLNSTIASFPDSEFVGAFASDEAESLFYSFQREHTTTANVDQAVYGVAAAAKVREGAIGENPVITTGFVHGVLVNKATGDLVSDIAESGNKIDLEKRWKEDTDSNNVQDLDVALHLIDTSKPVYGNITATNTDISQSEEREVLTLYSDYDSGDANSTLQRYSAEINNISAKLKDISYSYTINAKNVIQKIGDANSADTTNATTNALPLKIILYAKDSAGKFYMLATEAKTYSNVSDFDEWITEEFDFTNGNVQAIRLDTEAELEDHDTIQALFDFYESNDSLYASPLATWEADAASDPIADDAEVFKVVVKWGDATHTNEDTDTDTMALYLDKFTIKDENDEVIFEDDFLAASTSDNLFIDKDAFYIPMDAGAQDIFTPDISGYTKVDGKTVITALPGLEEYEYLIWGIWSSELTEDANPSNHFEAFGMFGGGMVKDLTDPAGYAAHASANNVVNYSGSAMGNLFDLSTNQSEFRSGNAQIQVNFSSETITGGTINLGNAQVKLEAGSLDKLTNGLPYNGSAKLGIGGATPSGTGTYKGQFFGNDSKYAIESSGSFGATNSTHKVIGAFGTKKE